MSQGPLSTRPQKEKACGTLVSQPRFEPRPSAMKVQSANHGPPRDSQKPPALPLRQCALINQLQVSQRPDWPRGLARAHTQPTFYNASQEPLAGCRCSEEATFVSPAHEGTMRAADSPAPIS